MVQSKLEAKIVTFTADLGQGEELELASRKTEMFGVKENKFILKIYRKNLYVILCSRYFE
nr:hypothetical protein BAR15_10022 [Bartonella sp. AR 15-3]